MALTKVGKEGITGIDNSSDATAITITSAENIGIGMTPNSNYGKEVDWEAFVSKKLNAIDGVKKPDFLSFRNGDGVTI